MGRVTLDSSVLLAVLDPTDALHASATRAFQQARVEGNTFDIPASVLAEVLVRAYRQGTEFAEQLEARIDRAVTEVRPIDRAVARTTAALRAKHPSVRIADALVMATGEVHNASAVLTGDKRWRGVTSRVRVIGPEDSADSTGHA